MNTDPEQDWRSIATRISRLRMSLAPSEALEEALAMLDELGLRVSAERFIASRLADRERFAASSVGGGS